MKKKNYTSRHQRFVTLMWHKDFSLEYSRYFSNKILQIKDLKISIDRVKAAYN